ncbi:MAG: RNA chaperone Hfq [Acidobacteria bacterium]|nr:RNA chaperone Hfq [Acidobacteriota bacterium]
MSKGKGEILRSTNPSEKRVGTSPARNNLGPPERVPQNIQDDFLNRLRRERTPVAVFLVSGVRLSGRIKSFDKYSLVLESEGQEQLLFKHAIATVVAGKASGPG